MHIPRKIAVAVLAGVSVAGMAGASAATLGGLTSGQIGSEDGAVGACDTTGITSNYTTAYNALAQKYQVTAVNFTNVDALCNSKAASVTLRNLAGTRAHHAERRRPSQSPRVRSPSRSPQGWMPSAVAGISRHHLGLSHVPWVEALVAPLAHADGRRHGDHRVQRVRFCQCIDPGWSQFAHVCSVWTVRRRESHRQFSAATISRWRPRPGAR